MRAALLLALASTACGAPARPPAALVSEGVLDEAAGTQIVLVPRSTRERLWLSLWIDAGSRDADPPELVTAALWAAAGSSEVAVRVLPDGIELTRSCRRPALRSCLEELATTVGTRRIDPDRWADAQRRLQQAYRRVGGDHVRRMDALALEALLGRSVDPLGDGQREATAEAAAAFLADHAGPGRLLLVAVGDVEPRELREAVQATFGRLPAARRARAPREVRGARAARVDVGERAGMAVATLRPSVADAARLARRLLARVDGDAPGAGASADAFPVRGGAALVARVEGTTEATRRALIDHLAELSQEPAFEAPDPPPTEDGPRALARWIGVRWACRQDAPARGGLGLGAVLEGGRGDRVGEADPDQALREAAGRELEAALRAATEPVPLDGRIAGDAVEVRIPGGAVIRARRLLGAARLSAVALFEGGAAEDPADAHGVTALLAQLASDGCEEVARRELGHTLESLGLETAPLLTADAWGVRVEGPPVRWREIAYLAPRCAGAPHLHVGWMESAREPLLAALRQPSQVGRAVAAGLLSPSAPGRVAPSGGAQGMAAVTVRTLAGARSQRVGRARARVALAGDVELDEAVRVLARGASRWPEGARPELGGWSPSSERLRGVQHPRERHEAVIAWLTRGPDPADVVAAAFASAVARALSAEPGLRPTWHEGGAQGGRAFAMVGLEASPDALDELPAHLARAMATIGWSEVADTAVADGEERRAWGESSPRRVAITLATAPTEPPRRDTALPVLQRLAESAPYYVVLRPQPRRR